MCIVTDGGWSPWTGKDILTKGLGGSETWVIETARNIKRTTDMDVIVFCNTTDSEIFDSVGFIPIGMFHNFVANNIVDYCIISRFTEYIPVALHTNVINIGIIFHDLLQEETIIPVNSKIKWIFGLTDWHCKHISKFFPQFKPIIKKLNYGIDQDQFTARQKIKNSFIYSSFPNRGLLVLLKMWPRIIKRFPDAVLNVYCNLEQTWVNEVAPDQMKTIKQIIKQKGVILHGWVSKDILADAWGSAEYFLYPCIFKETFCLTVVEAAITKTAVFTNKLAALSETVGDRGVIVNGDPLTQKWQDDMISKVFQTMDSGPDQIILEINYRWAKEKTWKSQSMKLYETIKFKKHWYLIKEIQDNLIGLTKDCKYILDIGCGKCPFGPSTLLQHSAIILGFSMYPLVEIR
jgi:glycosyltransferase involved in cell wall biosynthesis